MRKLGICAVAVALLACMASPGSSRAEPIFDADSLRISFQALLTDDLGEPLPGPTVDLTFTLYHPIIGPVEGPFTIQDVPISGGLVNVFVPMSRNNFDGSARELGVSVDGAPELAPRIPLVSVPHAFRVDRVENGELTDDIVAGDATHAGSVEVWRATGTASVRLDGAAGEIQTVDALGQARFVADDSGTMRILDSAGALAGRMTSSGDLQLNNLGNGFPSIYASGSAGTVSVPTAFTLYNFLTEFSRGSFADTNYGALIELYDDEANKTVELGNQISDGGYLRLRQTNGNQGVYLEGEEAGGGGSIKLYNTENLNTLRIDGDESGNGNSAIQLRDENNNIGVRLTSDNSAGGGELELFDVSGTETVTVVGEAGSGLGGYIELSRADGTSAIEIQASETVATGAQIVLKKTDGTTSIELDADFSGEGRIRTEVLEITGGADLSEQFEIACTSEQVAPGMLVSIDAQRPGALRLTSMPYDRCVAGIVSGAGGVKPGMLMGQRGSVADGRFPVALTGRVYCWCDASTGAISPGDLLTSSATAGHAMKADLDAAGGAVIGKAMGSLESGRGLVLVLVSLQ